MANITIDTNKEFLGSIGINLTEDSKMMLSKVVNELISPEEYFQSFDEGYTYINGNVTEKAHITVAYGIKNLNLKKQFDNSHLKINWQKSAKIKEVQINLGWQKLYYVIVAIPEIEKDIYEFNDSPAFDPHIALCYIKNQGDFPTKLFEKLKEKLLGKSIDFESVNFYQGDNKTAKIKLYCW